MRTGPTIRLRRESKKTCYHRSTLTQAVLDAFCQKYHIPDTVHPELPARNQSIHDSPAGKIGVYTRFFEFANFRIPLSQFLVDVLGYFCINLSQLSVIVAAKVDASVFPLSVLWHTKKTMTRDPSLAADEFSAEARYYDLDANVYPIFLTDAEEEMDLFAFIRHADPTKVQIGEWQIEEGQVPLLESTRGRVIMLAGESEQGGQHDNVKDAEPHGLNEEGGSDVVRDQTEGSGRVAQDEEVNIVVDEDVKAAVVDKPKVQKKRRRAAGASGSDHPPKKLREDHDTSSDVGASTGGKSLAAIQELFERSTLNVEVGVTVAATMHFITSSVTLTLEREGGGKTDSVSGPNLPTRHLAERFVISSDSSHHSSTNVADVEVTSIVRSSVPPPPVLTAVVASTTIAGATSAPVHGSGTGPVYCSIFRDSASPSAAEAHAAGPSHPAGAEVSADTFYVSQEMDSETLQQTYVPKWNVINDSALDDSELFAEFNVGVARQACFSAEVRLRSEHNYRERKKFKRKCNRQADLLKEKDVEIANLKAQLSLKEAEAAEAIRLRGQVATVEAAKAARVNELDDLKVRHLALVGEKGILEGQVATLESAASLKRLSVHL
ncbi:hypothetical protein Tco_0011815 [Tanacetum coccineum]